MPRITRILHKTGRARYWIYVDYAYCTSVRERTFPALNLRVGQAISYDRIKELENHHWKHTYGKKAWDKEKVRPEIVKSLIENISDEVSGVLFASIGVIHSHTRAEVEPK